MAKIDIPLTGYAEEIANALKNPGCLLVSGDMKEANVMTIGWGFIGVIWGKPVFIVAVRPSRHTFKFMEKTNDFTVNVPRKGMEEIVEYCGTVSGRDHDKINEKGLLVLPGRKVKSPVISECFAHYECKVIYKTRVIPEDVPEFAKEDFYPNDDFHTLYFGEIMSAYADEEAEENFP